MKALILIGILFLTTSFNSPLSDTWNGNAGNQVVSGNALRDGATVTGGYSITTAIPPELNKKAMTKANLATYTSISTGSIFDVDNNQYITKDDILSTF